MKPLVRLGLFGLLLVVVFAVSALVAHAVVPRDVVESWTQNTNSQDHSPSPHSSQSPEATPTMSTHNEGLKSS